MTPQPALKSSCSRKIEDATKKHKVWFPNAIELSRDSIMVCNPAGRLEDVNSAFERVTGYSKQEALSLNLPFLDNDENDSALFGEMWDTVLSGDIWRGQIVSKKKDGTLYIEEVIISPVQDETNTIVNYIAIKIDLTKQLALEAQLQRSERMESLGRLAGGVAHDFNNLLQVIIGYTSITASNLTSNNVNHTRLDEVLKAGDRAKALVRQLMLFCRNVNTKNENISVNSCVEDLVKMLNRVIGEDIAIELSLGTGLSPVNGDAAQIEQVLMNLCLNARDAMPAGGKISIKTKQTRISKTETASRPWGREGSYVILTVSDTGSGMTPEVRQQALDPFFTTKNRGEGTGLGLATVNATIQRHNGGIEVESETGRGTTFQIFLPISEKPKMTQTKIAPARKNSKLAETGTVLLAEDDEFVCDMATRALKRSGYSVIVAQDGEQAIDLFHKHQAEIDIAVLDVIMPKKSGRDVYDVINAISPSLPVLLCSGYSFDLLDKRGSLPNQTHELMRKPYDPGDFIQKINELLLHNSSVKPTNNRNNS